MQYEELCGKTTPFATLCHDVWNGVNKDVLGLLLMFADLRNGNVYHIPLGLIMAQGNRNMPKSKGWTLQSSLLMLWMDENLSQQSNKNC